MCNGAALICVLKTFICVQKIDVVVAGLKYLGKCCYVALQLLNIYRNMAPPIPSA